MIPDKPEPGYAEAAQAYWDNGWRGILPLKRGSKWPPPPGFTGYDGKTPSYADILEWCELYPTGNLCLRLPDGIVGIDVDAYGAKTGARAINEAIRRWGPLPEGPRSTSRDDDQVSGIRLFRIPEGTLLESVIVFPEMSIGDIEVIQPHHRYVVCWPSIHPEGSGYWWRNSKGQTKAIPPLDEIPDLPAAWIEGLKLTPRALDVDASFDTRQAVTPGEPSMMVNNRLAMAIKELNMPGMSRHDTCLRHVMAILRLGAEGQPGVDGSLATLREVFTAVVTMDGSRTKEQSVEEFNRMVTNNNVARELSQPGIMDWLKMAMDGSGLLDDDDDPDAQGANVYRADAGAIDPNATGETPGVAPPPPPEPLSELEALEEDFWTARPQHALIFSAALNRMVSPWAVFACSIARALQLVPPSVVLPPIIGSKGSLNWFGAVVAPSGSGKGAAMAVAKELVPSAAINVSSIGSGEGMIELYKRAPGKGENPPQPVTAVMFDVPEVDTLGAMKNRAGSTTGSILREGFVGGTLSLSYRGRQSESVAEHTYRMTMIISAQPTRVGALLEDDGGGTPQRFMWFPARDSRITADAPDWPVDLQGQPLTLTPNLTSKWRLDSAGLVTLPDEVIAEVREAAAARNRDDNDDDDDGLSGHAMFCRLKMAYALAFLESRLEVNLEDWRLSGIVAAVSARELGACVDALQKAKENEARDKGKLRGMELAFADLGKQTEQQDAARRVGKNLLIKIRESMPAGIANRDLTRKIAARDRGLVKDVLVFLTTEGKVAQVEGTKLWVLLPKP